MNNLKPLKNAYKNKEHKKAKAGGEVKIVKYLDNGWVIYQMQQ